MRPKKELAGKRSLLESFKSESLTIFLPSLGFKNTIFFNTETYSFAEQEDWGSIPGLSKCVFLLPRVWRALTPDT